VSETIKNGSFESDFDYWTNGPGDKHSFGIDAEMAKASSWEEDMIEGAIIAWIGGYFTGGGNAGYTRVLGSGNNVAAVNALLNSKGFYVCDGAALNLGSSTIFNGAGRYLPNLTDDRFIMGNNAAGGIGGSSTIAHTHGVGSYATASGGSHAHGTSSGTTGAGSSHSHGNGSYVGSQPTHTHSVSGNTGSKTASHSHGVGTYNITQSSHSHSVSGDVGTTVVNHTHTLSGHTHLGCGGGEQSAGPSPTNTGGAAISHHHSININTSSDKPTNVELNGVSASGGASHNHSISFTSGSGGNDAVSISGTSGSEGSHTHSYDRADQSAGAHTHTLSGISAAASNTENRPKFLSVFYLIYVFA